MNMKDLIMWNDFILKYRECPIEGRVLLAYYEKTDKNSEPRLKDLYNQYIEENDNETL